MTPCSFCGTSILFSGIRHGDGYYCNETCAADGQSSHISQADVDLCASKLHQANCPRCKGSGPLDLYASHRVISILVLSYRQSLNTLSCAKCGAKAQIRDLLITVFAGWWSLHGLIWTPIMMARNLAAMGKKHDPLSPSLELRTMARRQLGLDKKGDKNTLSAVLDEEKKAKFSTGQGKGRTDINVLLNDQAKPQYSRFALASLICGLVSLMPCMFVGVPCGIAAIILGVMAIRQLQGGFGSGTRIASIVGIISGALGIAVQVLFLSLTMGFWKPAQRHPVPSKPAIAVQPVEVVSSNADKFREAANKGDANAQYNLGLCYSKGDGVDLNQAEAVNWWRKAADQGLPIAQANLGACYAEGNGVDKNNATALVLFRKAAERGDPSAQYNIAAFYHNGQGVEKDDAEATKWYIKAAEQGLVAAQQRLGDNYYAAVGVEKDFAQATKWYLKAADSGNARAQLGLGFCFHYGGYGIQKDDAEAAKWLQKSAGQNTVDAQILLGVMYAVGQGVPKNMTEARKWLQKAADAGDSRAKALLKKVQ